MSKEKEVSQEAVLQAFEVKTDFAFKYGVNVGTRTIQLIGEINEDAFYHIETAMTLLEQQSKKAITIKINSPGGSVYDGMAIVGRIRASKCQVITEGYGAVMSAAIIILAAGHKRRMSKFGWCMWHEASYDHGGTVTQMEHFQRQMKREEQMGCDAMAEFTTSPSKFWANEGKLGKDLFLTAEESLTLGVVDEVF